MDHDLPQGHPKGAIPMSKLVRIVVQIPVEWKERLDGLKQEGYTTSGFIRAMVERELGHADRHTKQQWADAQEIAGASGQGAPAVHIENLARRV